MRINENGQGNQAGRRVKVQRILYPKVKRFLHPIDWTSGLYVGREVCYIAIVVRKIRRRTRNKIVRQKKKRPAIVKCFHISILQEYFRTKYHA